MFTGPAEAHLMTVNPQTGAVSLPTLTGELRTTGNLSIGNGQNHSTITMNDSDNGARFVHNNSNLIGFLNTGQNWTFRVDDAGAVWTAQLGDLNSRIENRANAHAVARANEAAATRIARTGDTMTGNLAITKDTPIVGLHFPNVAHYETLVASDGSLWVRHSGSGSPVFRIGSDGAISTAQLGDINTRIENRAAAHAQNGINAANARVTEIRTVSEYNSGNEIQAGSVVTNVHISGGFLTTTKAYIQIHRPDRGWSTMWRN